MRTDPRRLACLLLVVGLLTLVFPVAVGVREQHDGYPLWWTAAGLAALVASLVLAVAGHDVGSGRTVVATEVALLITLPLVETASRVQTPWPLYVIYVASGAAAVVSRRGSGVALAVLALVLARGWLSWRVDWGERPEDLVGSLLFVVTIAGGLTTVRLVLDQSVGRIGVARAEAVRRLEDARAVEAQGRAAALWDAYVHDEVLAVLADVQVSQDEIPAPVREAAARVVDDAGAAAAQGPPAPDLVDGLLDSTLEMCPSADTLVEVDDDAVPLPAEVRIALVEATREALRNVGRHAFGGEPAPEGTVEVSVHHDRRAVRVRVVDRGRGFDPDHTAPDRLGILVSVRGRMEAVGGRARVQSRRGAGTEVEVLWP
ncbi:ATP-binding protein [Nocardioides acrostichi]|uniref:ATP-binding protein n=1 Tax=Nocardioides acrostichi TaxID=2784339 RepID=A0A930UZC7_9ACTN|nr:ATP-binding protein [Nocardioides acrostichi]MBF4161815.1 ATP-binding protein [Nocardioides acrostichi]